MADNLPDFAQTSHHLSGLSTQLSRFPNLPMFNEMHILEAIERLQNTMDQRFTNLDQRLEQRFENLEQRFANLEQRFASLEQQISDMRVITAARYRSISDPQIVRLA